MAMKLIILFCMYCVFWTASGSEDLTYLRNLLGGDVPEDTEALLDAFDAYYDGLPTMEAKLAVKNNLPKSVYRATAAHRRARVDAARMFKHNGRRLNSCDGKIGILFYESYGDTWDGAKIYVHYNDVTPSEEYTIDEQETTFIVGPVCVDPSELKSIELQRNSATWTGEIGFEIWDNDSNKLYSYFHSNINECQGGDNADACNQAFTGSIFFTVCENLICADPCRSTDALVRDINLQSCKACPDISGKTLQQAYRADTHLPVWRRTCASCTPKNKLLYYVRKTLFVDGVDIDDYLNVIGAPVDNNVLHWDYELYDNSEDALTAARAIIATKPALVDLGGTPSSSNKPLSECEADCDNNNDCESGLICFQRDNNEIVPGCTGVYHDFIGLTIPSDHDACIKPYSQSIELEFIAGDPTDKLKRCQGDCDSDVDCIGHLRCYERVNSSPNPTGCSGTALHNYDYCYDPTGQVDVPTGLSSVPTRGYKPIVCTNPNYNGCYPSNYRYVDGGDGTDYTAVLRPYSGCGYNMEGGDTNTYPDGTTNCDASQEKRIQECAAACSNLQRGGTYMRGFLVRKDNGRCYCSLVDGNDSGGLAPDGNYFGYDFDTPSVDWNLFADGSCDPTPDCPASSSAAIEECICGSGKCSIGQVCHNGQCLDVCISSDNIAEVSDCMCGSSHCEAGKTCLNGQCLDVCVSSDNIAESSDCMCGTSHCEAGKTCLNGQCLDACTTDITIAQSSDCMCGSSQCDAGKFCAGDACLDTVCPIGVQVTTECACDSVLSLISHCLKDRVCLQGTGRDKGCYPLCEDVSVTNFCACGIGDKDPCVTGEYCVNGQCIDSLCPENTGYTNDCVCGNKICEFTNLQGYKYCSAGICNDGSNMFGQSKNWGVTPQDINERNANPGLGIAPLCDAQYCHGLTMNPSDCICGESFNDPNRFFCQTGKYCNKYETVIFRLPFWYTYVDYPMYDGGVPGKDGLARPEGRCDYSDGLIRNTKPCWCVNNTVTAAQSSLGHRSCLGDCNKYCYKGHFYDNAECSNTDRTIKNAQACRCEQTSCDANQYCDASGAGTCYDTPLCSYDTKISELCDCDGEDCGANHYCLDRGDQKICRSSNIDCNTDFGIINAEACLCGPNLQVSAPNMYCDGQQFSNHTICELQTGFDVNSLKCHCSADFSGPKCDAGDYCNAGHCKSMPICEIQDGMTQQNSTCWCGETFGNGTEASAGTYCNSGQVRSQPLCFGDLRNSVFPKVYLSTDADMQCDSNPCVRGTCKKLDGGTKCVCPPGYAGEMCERHKSESPCSEGAYISSTYKPQTLLPYGISAEYCLRSDKSNWLWAYEGSNSLPSYATTPELRVKACYEACTNANNDNVIYTNRYNPNYWDNNEWYSASVFTVDKNTGTCNCYVGAPSLFDTCSSGIYKTEEIRTYNGITYQRDGYTIEHTCETPCSPNPCNSGTCTEQGNSFICSCPRGYEGEKCEHHVSNTPCSEGAYISSTYTRQTDLTEGVSAEYCMREDSSKSLRAYAGGDLPSYATTPELRAKACYEACINANKDNVMDTVYNPNYWDNNEWYSASTFNVRESDGRCYCFVDAPSDGSCPQGTYKTSSEYVGYTIEHFCGSTPLPPIIQANSECHCADSFASNGQTCSVGQYCSINEESVGACKDTPFCEIQDGTVANDACWCGGGFGSGDACAAGQYCMKGQCKNVGICAHMDGLETNPSCWCGDDFDDGMTCGQGQACYLNKCYSHIICPNRNGTAFNAEPCYCSDHILLNGLDSYKANEFIFGDRRPAFYCDVAVPRIMEAPYCEPYTDAAYQSDSSLFDQKDCTCVLDSGETETCKSTRPILTLLYAKENDPKTCEIYSSRYDGKKNCVRSRNFGVSTFIENDSCAIIFERKGTLRIKSMAIESKIELVNGKIGLDNSVPENFTVLTGLEAPVNKNFLWLSKEPIDTSTCLTYEHESYGLCEGNIGTNTFVKRLKPTDDMYVSDGVEECMLRCMKDYPNTQHISLIGVVGHEMCVCYEHHECEYTTEIMFLGVSIPSTTYNLIENTLACGKQVVWTKDITRTEDRTVNIDDGGRFLWSAGQHKGHIEKNHATGGALGFDMCLEVEDMDQGDTPYCVPKFGCVESPFVCENSQVIEKTPHCVVHDETIKTFVSNILIDQVQNNACADQVEISGVSMEQCLQKRMDIQSSFASCDHTNGQSASSKNYCVCGSALYGTVCSKGEYCLVKSHDEIAFCNSQPLTSALVDACDANSEYKYNDNKACGDAASRGLWNTCPDIEEVDEEDGECVDVGEYHELYFGTKEACQEKCLRENNNAVAYSVRYHKGGDFECACSLGSCVSVSEITNPTYTTKTYRIRHNPLGCILADCPYQDGMEYEYDGHNIMAHIDKRIQTACKCGDKICGRGKFCLNEPTLIFNENQGGQSYCLDYPRLKWQETQTCRDTHRKSATRRFEEIELLGPDDRYEYEVEFDHWNPSKYETCYPAATGDFDAGNGCPTQCPFDQEISGGNYCMCGPKACESGKTCRKNGIEYYCDNPDSYRTDDGLSNTFLNRAPGLMSYAYGDETIGYAYEWNKYGVVGPLFEGNEFPHNTEKQRKDYCAKACRGYGDDDRLKGFHVNPKTGRCICSYVKNDPAQPYALDSGYYSYNFVETNSDYRPSAYMKCPTDSNAIKVSLEFSYHSAGQKCRLTSIEESCSSPLSGYETFNIRETYNGASEMCVCGETTCDTLDYCMNFEGISTTCTRPDNSLGSTEVSSVKSFIPRPEKDTSFWSGKFWGPRYIGQPVNYDKVEIRHVHFSAITETFDISELAYAGYLKEDGKNAYSDGTSTEDATIVRRTYECALHCKNYRKTESASAYMQQNFGDYGAIVENVRYEAASSELEFRPFGFTVQEITGRCYCTFKKASRSLMVSQGSNFVTYDFDGDIVPLPREEQESCMCGPSKTLYCSKGEFCSRRTEYKPKYYYDASAGYNGYPTYWTYKELMEWYEYEENGEEDLVRFTDIETIEKCVSKCLWYDNDIKGFAYNSFGKQCSCHWISLSEAKVKPGRPGYGMQVTPNSNFVSYDFLSDAREPIEIDNEYAACSPFFGTKTLGEVQESHCAAGEYKSDDDTCEVCPAGYWSPDSSTYCSECDAGKYSIVTGGTSETTCIECPNGWYSNSCESHDEALFYAIPNNDLKNTYKYIGDGHCKTFSIAFAERLDPKHPLYDTDAVKECVNRCLYYDENSKSIFVKGEDFLCRCSNDLCLEREPSPRLVDTQLPSNAEEAVYTSYEIVRNTAGCSRRGGQTSCSACPAGTYTYDPTNGGSASQTVQEYNKHKFVDEEGFSKSVCTSCATLTTGINICPRCKTTTGKRKVSEDFPGMWGVSCQCGTTVCSADAYCLVNKHGSFCNTEKVSDDLDWKEQCSLETFGSISEYVRAVPFVYEDMSQYFSIVPVDMKHDYCAADNNGTEVTHAYCLCGNSAAARLCPKGSFCAIRDSKYFCNKHQHQHTQLVSLDLERNSQWAPGSDKEIPGFKLYPCLPGAANATHLHGKCTSSEEPFRDGFCQGTSTSFVDVGASDYAGNIGDLCRAYCLQQDENYNFFTLQKKLGTRKEYCACAYECDTLDNTWCSLSEWHPGLMTSLPWQNWYPCSRQTSHIIDFVYPTYTTYKITKTLEMCGTGNKLCKQSSVFSSGWYYDSAPPNENGGTYCEPSNIEECNTQYEHYQWLESKFSTPDTNYPLDLPVAFSKCNDAPPPVVGCDSDSKKAALYNPGRWSTVGQEFCNACKAGYEPTNKEYFKQISPDYRATEHIECSPCEYNKGKYSDEHGLKECKDMIGCPRGHSFTPQSVFEYTLPYETTMRDNMQINFQGNTQKNAYVLKYKFPEYLREYVNDDLLELGGGCAACPSGFFSDVRDMSEECTVKTRTCLGSYYPACARAEDENHLCHGSGIFALTSDSDILYRECKHDLCANRMTFTVTDWDEDGIKSSNDHQNFMCIDTMDESFLPKNAGSCIASDGGRHPDGSVRDRECFPCPPGTYSDVEDAAECKLCPTGQFQPGRGMDLTSCIECGAGTYQDVMGQVSCKYCNDSETSDIGSKSREACTACEAGRFMSSTEVAYVRRLTGWCKNPFHTFCWDKLNPKYSDEEWRNEPSSDQDFSDIAETCPLIRDIDISRVQNMAKTKNMIYADACANACRSYPGFIVHHAPESPSDGRCYCTVSVHPNCEVRGADNNVAGEWVTYAMGNEDGSQPGCTECPPGTFSGASDPLCIACPSGTFSTGGAAACTDWSDNCDLGHEGLIYPTPTNDLKCHECRPGFFRDNLDTIDERDNFLIDTTHIVPHQQAEKLDGELLDDFIPLLKQEITTINTCVFDGLPIDNEKTICPMVDQQNWPSDIGTCPEGTHVYHYGSHCCRVSVDKKGDPISFMSSSCKDNNYIVCPYGSADGSCSDTMETFKRTNDICSRFHYRRMFKKCNKPSTQTTVAALDAEQCAAMCSNLLGSGHLGNFDQTNDNTHYASYKFGTEDLCLCHNTGSCLNEQDLEIDNNFMLLEIKTSIASTTQLPTYGPTASVDDNYVSGERYGQPSIASHVTYFDVAAPFRTEATQICEDACNEIPTTKSIFMIKSKAYAYPESFEYSSVAFKPKLVHKGLNAIKYGPIQVCEGECNNDDECAGDSICFIRGANEPVPGCSGSIPRSINVCINPVTREARSYVGSGYTLCEGDCNSDAECANGLFCHFRSNNEYTPGCSGPGFVTSATDDICYDPEIYNPVLVQGVGPSVNVVQRVQCFCSSLTTEECANTEQQVQVKELDLTEIQTLTSNEETKIKCTQHGLTSCLTENEYRAFGGTHLEDIQCDSCPPGRFNRDDNVFDCEVQPCECLEDGVLTTNRECTSHDPSFCDVCYQGYEVKLSTDNSSDIIFGLDRYIKTGKCCSKFSEPQYHGECNWCTADECLHMDCEDGYADANHKLSDGCEWKHCSSWNIAVEPTEICAPRPEQQYFDMNTLAYFVDDSLMMKEPIFKESDDSILRLAKFIKIYYDENWFGKSLRKSTNKLEAIQKPTQMVDTDIRPAVDKCLQEEPIYGNCKEYGKVSNFGVMSKWDVSEITDMSYLFKLRLEFQGDLSKWNTGNVENMAGMFEDCLAFDSDITQWDVSKVRNMSYMFSNNRLKKIYMESEMDPVIQRFVYTSVESFTRSSFNQNISGWNVRSVLDMSGMFKNADAFSQSLTEWQTERVRSFEDMFRGTRLFDGDIRHWNVASAVTVAGMFAESIFNMDISEWNTLQILNASHMFYNNKHFNQNMPSMINVMDITSMFEGAEAMDILYDKMFYRYTVTTNIFKDATTYQQHFVCDDANDGPPATCRPALLNDNIRDAIRDCLAISADGNCPELYYGAMPDWKTSKVTDMKNLFAKSEIDGLTTECYTFNADISKWNTANVIDMSQMFAYCEYNGDISTWNTSNVIQMDAMFAFSTFNQDISNWNVGATKSMSQMFASSSFNQDISKWNVASLQDATEMFKESEFKKPLAAWNIQSNTIVTDMLDADYRQQMQCSMDISGVVVTTCDGCPSEDHIAVTYPVTLVTTITVDNVISKDLCFAECYKHQGNVYGFDKTKCRYYLHDGTTCTLGFCAKVDCSNGDCDLPLHHQPCYSMEQANHTGHESDQVETLPSEDWYAIPSIDGCPIRDMDRALTWFTHDVQPYGSLDQWDTSYITDMSDLRLWTKSIDGEDISGWDVSSVTSMAYMFGTPATETLVGNDFGDFSNWDVSSVTSMEGMFKGGPSVQGLRHWDVSAVTNLNRMFYENTGFVESLMDWNLAPTVSRQEMFDHSKWLEDQKLCENNKFCPRFTSTNIHKYVDDCLDASPDGKCFNLTDTEMAEWDVREVTSMSGLFKNKRTFSVDISQWDVSSVTDMSDMFFGAQFFNSNLNQWDTSKVVNMDRMFFNAHEFHGTVSAWDISSVTSLRQMFYNARRFSDNIVDWSYASDLDFTHMMTNADRFHTRFDCSRYYFLYRGRCENGIGSQYLSKQECKDAFTQLTGSVQEPFELNSNVWPRGCFAADDYLYINVNIASSSSCSETLQCLCKDSFNVRPEDCQIKYVGPPIMEQYELRKAVDDCLAEDPVKGQCVTWASSSGFGVMSQWNTKQITNMEQLFKDRKEFDADISGWDVSNVNTMREMFMNAINFKQDISMWNFKLNTNKEKMFKNARSFFLQCEETKCFKFFKQ